MKFKETKAVHCNLQGLQLALPPPRTPPNQPRQPKACEEECMAHLYAQAAVMAKVADQCGGFDYDINVWAGQQLGDSGHSWLSVGTDDCADSLQHYREGGSVAQQGEDHCLCACIPEGTEPVSMQQLGQQVCFCAEQTTLRGFF